MHAVQYTKPRSQPDRRTLSPVLQRRLRRAGIAAAVVAFAAIGALAHHLTPREEGTWLKNLATGGDSGAQLELGLAYRSGRDGLPVDPQQSLYWLMRAAQGGSAYAADLVGNAFAQGDGVDVDSVQAEHWWQVAAAAGNADAKHQLGQTSDDSLQRLEHIVTGQVIRDQSGAQLKARAAAHDPVAEFQLAERYRNGAWAVRQDPGRAQQMMERAAEDGNPVAQTILESDHQ